MHPRRGVHRRLTRRAVVLGALLALAPSSARAAPRCLRDSCAQRLLRRAVRCFDARGACVRDDPAGITCWANGARSTTKDFPDSGAERSLYLNAHGRVCQTVTSITDASGYQRTTHVRRGRKVVFQTTATGLRVRCPGGRVERYTTADLAAAECADPTPPLTCDAGRCD